MIKKLTSGAATTQAGYEQMAGIIVGIGASAGGLAAFRAFLDHMPSDSGMSFILVQHLDPDHASMLVELLTPHTDMPVSHAQDGKKVDSNNVYVIPPNATLTVSGGILRVTSPAPPRERRRPIDSFFVSLAEDQGERAASIILAGVGSDGTAGVRSIKEHGGLTLAQAEFDETAMQGMPTSAAATGLVDHIVPIESMPDLLMAHQEQIRASRRWQADKASHEDWQEHLKKVGAALRNSIGHDFTDYKENTLIRRVQRRMQVLKIADVTAYVARLETDAHEPDLLFRNLLIGVTQFFRDAEAFDALRTTVLPTLLSDRDPDDPVRIWVPGCATGEEVYSLAILLKEAMAAAKVEFKIQIFGSDLDPNAISVARAARYRNAAAEVSPERLNRWFAIEGDIRCPVKSIREMCVFSVHSIVKDPPFSKLDLISCRNVLIYLNSELQRRVIQTFHYALKPGGYLFLGSSEGVAGGSELFALLDKTHRMLRRLDNGSAPGPRLRPSHAMERSVLLAPSTNLSDDSIERSARRVIEPYSPPYFVIDRKHDILRFSGADTARYLEPTSGTASLNLFSLLRRTLRPIVRTAVLAAQTERRGVVEEVSAPGPDGGNHTVSLIVEPIEAGSIVVAFRERRRVDGSADHEFEDDASVVPARELHAVKAQLKAAASELETYMEEAKSANEEMQSINEELQSTNEELETSKEEMQSVNEELQTVNAELSDKNAMLNRTNDDLQNLLDSTQIATLFLDCDLRIRKFTPAMTEIFSLRQGDIGRPITDIASKLDYADFEHDVEEVQRTLGVIEREVYPAGRNSVTFLMRIRPYRTTDNRLDGAVLTFMDVTEMKLAQQGLLHLAAIVQSSDEAIVSKTLDGVITTWNGAAERLFGYTAEEAVGRSITMLVPSELQDEEQEILARLKRGERIERHETVRQRKDGSRLEVVITVSPVKDAAGKIIGASKIAHDISERKRAEQNLAVVMRELSHRSKNLLSVIVSMAQQTANVAPSVDVFLDRFKARVQGLAKSHDLLIQENWSGAALENLVHHQLRPFADAGTGRIEVNGPHVTVSPDAAQTIGLALHELATNASKYGALSVSQGKVFVQWAMETLDREPRFRMMWRERGGPPVKPPQENGFGRRLIEGVTTQKLNAKVALTFEVEGVTWTLDAPAGDVLKNRGDP